MAFVRHGVLTASAVTAIQLPLARYDSIEIVNRDGSDEIYYVVATAKKPLPDPTPEGDDVDVLPAAMNAVYVNAPDGSQITVKLVSVGTPAFSIRAA